jgi:hypothetical protein
MTERAKSYLTSQWAYLLYGFLAATLIILGIRFFTYAPHHTHYHANFAVYIEGKQETFKDPQYYQEVNMCHLHNTMTPLMRTHMHNETAGVIHVHDDAVTWGQFFENLGWIVGPDFVRTRDKLYTSDDVNKLYIMLNGQDLTGLTTITDQTIEDRDRLLLSFGSVDQTALNAEYKTVPNNAARFDSQKDPASCAGSEAVTIQDRLTHLF